MRRFGWLLMLVLLVMAMAFPVRAQDGTIVDIAAGNEDFSTLVAAVQAADPSIAEALSGADPLTVFAPTNAAFEALLANLGLSAEELLADTELLNTVLTYHVVEGAVLAEDVIALDGQEVTTLLGEPISVSVVDGGVVLNGSVNVVTTDILASNGVVHVIDAVLLPPSLSAAPAEEAAEEMPAGDVNIRVAHFSPDTPAVDVYVNGEAAITDLAYPNVTGFVTLPAGTYEIAVAPAGTSIEEAAIGPAPFDLPAGEFITVAAVGSLAGGTLDAAVLVEDFSPLPEGSARVTAFHAIEGAPLVNVVTADGAVLVESLAFPGTLVYDDGTRNDGGFPFDVAAGTYDLSIVTTEEGAEVLALGETTLNAGTYYLVAAIGTAEAPAVSVTAVEEAAIAELRPMEMMEDMEEGEAAAEPTILEIAAGNADFSTLVAAVQAADPGIAEALAGAGPLTVFAPTNAAFEDLLAALDLTAEELLADTELLNTVLTYHVVEGAVLAEDVIALDGQTATTLQGEPISISVVDGGVVLNDSVNVVTTDILASNGVVHVIDAVLIPPSVAAALAE